MAEEERTGVVLSVVDDFSATTAQYVAAMRQVETAQMAVVEASRRAAELSLAGHNVSLQIIDTNARVAQTTAVAAKANTTSAAAVARYGVAAAMVTGQLQALGVANGAVARTSMLASHAISGMMGPIGIAAVAAASLAAAMVASFRYTGQQRDAANQATDALILQSRETGFLTDAERRLAEQRLASIRVELAQIETEIAHSETMGVQLKWYENLIGVAQAWVYTLAGMNQAEAYAAAMRNVGTGAMERHKRELADLIERQRELQAILEAGNVAMQGGQRAIDEARRKAEEYSRAVAQQKRDIESLELARMDLLKQRSELEIETYDMSFEGMIRQSLAMQQSANLERNIAAERAANRIEEIRQSIGDEQLRAEQIRLITENLAFEIENIETRLQARLRALKGKANAEDDQRKAEREAKERRWAAVIVGYTNIVGTAAGAAAAGSAEAWRQASIQMIQAGAQEAAFWFAKEAYKAGASGNWAKAAAMAAAAVATASAAAYATEKLQAQSRHAAASYSGSVRGGDGSSYSTEGIPWSGGENWSRPYYTPPPPTSIDQRTVVQGITVQVNTTGDVTPESARRWKREMEDAVTEALPNAVRRWKAVGGRLN